MRSLRIGSIVKRLSISTIKPMPTDMEAGNRERARLYNTVRWKRARLRFLQDHPLCRLCEEQGIIKAACVVDHRLGHQRQDWHGRFFDETQWQALCLNCHAAKSAEELAAWRRAGEGQIEPPPIKAGEHGERRARLP
jgi:5-methylcytosine-specific restriction enzyme A